MDNYSKRGLLKLKRGKSLNKDGLIITRIKNVSLNQGSYLVGDTYCNTIADVVEILNEKEML